MIKKMLMLMIAITIIFANGVNVKAASCFETSLSSKTPTTVLSDPSKGSSPCGGKNCANTVGIIVGKYKFTKTAVYGMRLTITTKNGTEKQIRNFWATENMKDFVKSKHVQRLGKTKSNNYFVKANLYGYKNGSGYDLHRLNYKSATYKEFVEDDNNGLSKIDRLNKYLAKFSTKYNNARKIYDGKYTIKIEPIYVLRHFHSTYGTAYYAGTSKEILTKRNVHDLGLVTQLNSPGNEWHVIENYLKTIYTESHGNNRNNWYNAAGKTAGVGFLKLNEDCITRPKITITKYQSTAKKDYKTTTRFEGCAKFKIFKKNKNGTFKNVTSQYYPKNSKKKKSAIELGDGCSGKPNSIEVTVDEGTYQVREDKSVTKLGSKKKINSRYSSIILSTKKSTRTGLNSNSFSFKKNSGATATVKFYNQVKETQNDKYIIQAHMHQANFVDENSWWTKSSNAKPQQYHIYNYIFKKDNDSNKRVCGTGKGKYQCYKMFQCTTCNQPIKYNNKLDPYNVNSYNLNVSDNIKEIPHYKGSSVLELQKYTNGKWKKQGGQKKYPSNANGNIVKWTVSKKGTYRIVQKSCGNGGLCRNGRTYVKTQQYKNEQGDRMKGNFRRKMESAGFYVGKKKGENNPYKVWFVNQILKKDKPTPTPDPCETDLENIKKKNLNVKQLKVELWKLWKKYNHTNLLNFNANDADLDNIKKNVSCTTAKQIDPKKPDCKENSIVKDIKSVPVANYITGGNMSGIVLKNKKNDIACTMNYKFSLDKIQSGIKTYGYFIWETNPTSQVGTLSVDIHCEGLETLNADDLKSADEIKKQVIESLDGISLMNNGKVFQTLIIKSKLELEDYHIKIADSELSGDNSDMEDSTSDDDDDLFDENDTDKIYDETMEEDTLDDDLDLADDELDDVLENEDDDEGDYTGELTDDNENDEEIEEEANSVNISSDAGYPSLDSTIGLKVVYKSGVCSDRLTGTALIACDDVNSINLGFGVPIPINLDNGEIVNIIPQYNYDENNDIVKALKSTYKSLIDKQKKGNACSYELLKTGKSNKKENDYKVRFVDTSNPFAGKSGSSNRKIGMNWNTCYNNVLNKIGKTSNISYCDVYQCSPEEKVGQKNVYCLYGDTNCDGNIEGSLGHKDISDINQDGTLDNFDTDLINIWINNKDNLKDIKNACETYSETYSQSHNQSTDILIDKYIINANNSLSNEVLYSFTLTPSVIQKIREDNKKNEAVPACVTDDETGAVKKDNDGNPICSDNADNKKYNSYFQLKGLTCTNNGSNCTSDFIKKLIDEKIGFKKK